MTQFLVRLARVFIALLAVRAIILALRSWLRPRVAARTHGHPATGVDLVRDRICNTFLPRERALAVPVPGGEEYFCSPACRDRATLSRAS